MRTLPTRKEIRLSTTNLGQNRKITTESLLTHFDSWILQMEYEMFQKKNKSSIGVDFFGRSFTFVWVGCCERLKMQVVTRSDFKKNMSFIIGLSYRVRRGRILDTVYGWFFVWFLYFVLILLHFFARGLYSVHMYWI